MTWIRQDPFEMSCTAPRNGASMAAHPSRSGNFGPTKASDPVGRALAAFTYGVSKSAFEGARVSSCMYHVFTFLNKKSLRWPDIPRPIVRCVVLGRRMDALAGGACRRPSAGRFPQPDGAHVHPCPPEGGRPKRAASGQVLEAARREAVTCTPNRTPRRGAAATRTPLVGRVVTLND